MTHPQLLAALLAERYGTTRPEDVAGYGRAPDWDDSEITTARRQQVLLAAVVEHEGGRRWRAA